MRRFIKIMVSIIVLAVIIGSGIAYYMYNKPHENIEAATPDFMVSSGDLYVAFEKNDSAAAQKYKDKILQLDGTIDKIISKNDTDFTILLAVDKAPLGNIKCTMDPQFASRLKNYNKGQSVSIKGICIGANKTEDLGLTMLDIEMTRCVVAE